MTAILKLNLGAVQCWTLIELGLRVNLNIKLTEALKKSVITEKELESSERTQQFVKNDSQKT